MSIVQRDLWKNKNYRYPPFFKKSFYMYIAAATGHSSLVAEIREREAVETGGDATIWKSPILINPLVLLPCSTPTFYILCLVHEIKFYSIIFPRHLNEPAFQGSSLQLLSTAVSG